MTLASEAQSSGLTLPDKQHTIRYADQPAPTQLADGITMSVEPDNDNEEDSGLTYNDDGSVTVNEPEKPKKTGKKKFDANLAEDMDETELNKIASDLLEAIAADIDSRKEWQETFNRGIDLLGLKIESPTSDVTGGGNISKVKDPLLLEAVLRYQSNFNAEMLPADGPVKVRDDKVQMPVPPVPPGGPPAPDPMLGHNGGPPMGGMPAETVSRSELAEAFEKDINHYLTCVDRAYYADTDRMSFSQALGGCAFKKVYRDPIENRPISRFVMATHLIVNNGASSLHDAKRITHEIPSMSKIVFMQMVEAGAYLDVDLSEPTSDPGPVDAKIAETEGRKPRVDRPEDRDYTIYECYCYLDFEEPTKPPRPYRVSLEKDSRVVLEIRRDWREKDKQFKRRRHFAKYPLFPGLGFYDYGFVHILGNTTRVLSAIESLMVDSGMFSNFPGGLIAKNAAKQEGNQIRPGPGGFKSIDTFGMPIQQIVMPMPYKPIDQGLMTLAQGLQAGGQKLASISELPLGEGRADVPVGTVIAMIEQNQKLLSAVHKRNHAAQQEEFEMLKELFMEDPEALIRLAKNPARQWEVAEEFEDLDLIPASDPNVSSHLLRIMRATAVLQMAQQAPPGLMNVKEVIIRALRVMGEEDIDALFNPPQPPQPPPHMIDAQLKAQQMQQKNQSDQQESAAKMQMEQMELADKEKDRQNALQLEQMRASVQAMKDAREFQAGITPPNGMAPSGGTP